MSFILRPSSERSKITIVYKHKIKGKREMSSRLDEMFPFSKMQVGQSFYLRYDECPIQFFPKAKYLVARLNRYFNVYFLTIEHKDEPHRIEVARLF